MHCNFARVAAMSSKFTSEAEGTSGNERMSGRNERRKSKPKGAEGLGMEGERERESVETRQGYGERTVEEELCERVNARARARATWEGIACGAAGGRPSYTANPRQPHSITMLSRIQMTVISFGTPYT